MVRVRTIRGAWPLALLAALSAMACGTEEPTPNDTGVTDAGDAPDAVTADATADTAADTTAPDVPGDAAADATPTDVPGDAATADAGDAADVTEGRDTGADVSTDAPADAPDAGPRLEGAAALSLGIEYSCARMVDGTARCWGENRSSELGDGTTTSRGTSAPVAGVGGAGMLTGVAQVAATYSRSTCARMTDGTVRCWGRQYTGPVPKGGMGTVFAAPTPLAGLTGVAQIAGGISFWCARLAGGTVQCWGNNGYGQLGSGSSAAFELTPQTVVTAAGGPALTGVTQVAVGHHFACALRMDGAVLCWGSNQDGQLGDGSAPGVSARRTFAAVTMVTGAVEVVAGHRHACARRTDGAVHCWGSNSTGQLGDGTTTGGSTPRAVTGLAGVAQLAAEGDGFSATTCARMADGTARCWGANHRGQLGDGTMTDRRVPTPVLAPGGAGMLTGVTDLAVGGIHACAVVAGGAVACWGRNAYGQLGEGTLGGQRPVPVYAR